MFFTQIMSFSESSAKNSFWGYLTLSKNKETKSRLKHDLTPSIKHLPS